MKKITIQQPPVATEKENKAFERIYGNLFFAGKNIKSITLAACGEDGDNSLAAWKLARCAAAHGEKVLLVDADFSGSRMTDTFGISLGGDGLGLAHYLNGRCSLDDVVYETSLENISLVPVGANVANPLLLLASPEFRAMADTLVQRYDRVLFLAPNNRKLAAAEASFTDGAVLIARDNKTPFSKVVLMKEMLEKTGSALLGCIVLDVARTDHYTA